MRKLSVGEVSFKIEAIDCCVILNWNDCGCGNNQISIRWIIEMNDSMIATWLWALTLGFNNCEIVEGYYGPSIKVSYKGLLTLILNRLFEVSYQSLRVVKNNGH